MAITNSAAETRKLGERLAGQLKAGDVILLEGELGAGKSELARGVAKGLGVQETVTSPSFTILNVYESGRVPLYHFDWYRLESAGELYELGMDEYLGGDGIALVEDRSCYAGSVQSLDKMIGNLVFDCNIPLVDAVRMASLTPAEIIGQAHLCGSLAVGKRADLCWMNGDLQVIKTVVAGKIIYEKVD